MTLFELRKIFNTELAQIYPKSEIESIFSLLVEAIFTFDKATMILEGNKEITKLHADTLKKALYRLRKNEPVQHIIGMTTFYNLPFKVNTHVLIPRPETEELVAWIIKDYNEKVVTKKVTILDIGTGSGCIAISLAKNIPNSEVWAIDISEKAIATAKENARINKVTIKFIKQDILNTKILPQSFDIIVSNPPYIRLKEKELIHDNVKKFEPKEALFVSDANALIFYTKISELSLNYLHSKGFLYFEINQYIAHETATLIKDIGFTQVKLRKDLLSNNRMIRAQHSINKDDSSR